MASTSAIWQQTAHTSYQLLSPSRLTAAIQNNNNNNNKKQNKTKTNKHTHTQKNYLLTKMFQNVQEKFQENGPLAEKLQDRKSKRTRQKNKIGDRNT